MKLQLPHDGEGGGVATLGPQVKLKKNVFQGIVVQVRDVTTLPAVLASVRALPRLRKSQHMPHAMRVRLTSSLHPAVLLASLRPEDEDCTKKKKYRPTDDPTVAEEWDDDGESGVGDRLLHLLERWQVENVLLVVARQDDSFSGRLIGLELFKLMTETAKLALEQYYLSRIQPSDAAKLEIFEASGGTAQYIASPREDPSSPQQQKQQHRASVCLMTSDTVQSWPQNHEPTSDGGGRKVAKKGRVNHFLHGRKASILPSATAEEPATTIAESEDSSPARSASPPATGPDATETLVACGGIDWLNISRDEWLKLRAIRVPVKELHYLFMCLVVLVDKPLEKQTKAAAASRQTEEFNAQSYSWNRCREVLQHTTHWSDKLRDFHGSSLTKSQVAALRSVLQEPTVNEASLVRISSASVKLFAWIQRLLDEHDEHELGIASLPTQSSSPSPLPHQQAQRPPGFSPQPPPPKQTKQPTMQNITFATTEAESALLRELNALTQSSSKRNKIVDRGRLLSHKHVLH